MSPAITVRITQIWVGIPDEVPVHLVSEEGFPSGKTPASGIFLSLVTGEIISDWKMEELELGVSSGALKMVFTVPSVDLLKVASVSFIGF